MKRKQLLIIGGLAALAAGAFFLFRKPKAPEIAPPLLPPGTTPEQPGYTPTFTPPVTPTPAPVVLTIGDRVAMKLTTRALNTATFGGYYKGGSDNTGQIEKDKFAGIITGFKTGASGQNYAILQGYQYAPADENGKFVYSFMIPTNALTKI
ncbi:MAG: hypothetical protein EBU84_19090 [Actinobacteria bacterium]|nr:hypothetical protein [Actinomycetota bacterium]